MIESEESYGKKKNSAEQGMELGRGHVGVLSGAIRADLTEKMTSDQTDACGEEDSPKREELVPGGQWGRSEKGLGRGAGQRKP